MLINKEDDDHIERHIEGRKEAGQQKFQPRHKKKRQGKSDTDPIEIKIYEDQMNDSGRMMLKISFAGKEIRQFTKR